MNSSTPWKQRIALLILLTSVSASSAWAWNLPTLELVAAGVSTNNGKNVEFTANFVLETFVRVTDDTERMYFRSELLAPDLLVNALGVPTGDSNCLTPRQPPHSPETPHLLLCDVRLLDFGQSGPGEFSLRAITQIASLNDRESAIPTEFSVDAKVNQVGRDVIAELRVTVPSSPEFDAQPLFPETIEYRYTLEPCFERHEVQIDSINFLRNANAFAIKSHASTLWAQGALGCQSRTAAKSL